MKIYCMSDIHGYLEEFEEALSMVLEHLEEEDTKLILLGDYVHRGPDGRGVMERIMELQYRYGQEKVIALLGNHDEWVVEGVSSIDYMNDMIGEESEEDDDRYIKWLSLLPKYHVEGNTIFVHAGIDEDAGDLWEWATGDDIFMMKYPPETGKIYGIDMKVVAGHVGTGVISGDPGYHDIYYDGESHYYIDGMVFQSGVIPVLMVDTETDKYYQMCKDGAWLILPYDEWVGR